MDINLNADTAHYEAAYGKCRAGSPAEGTWFQSNLPHQIQLSDNCGEVGLRFEMPNDFSIGLRYVNFGQYATYAIANNDPQDLQSLRGTVNSDHMRAACNSKNPGAPKTGLHEDCYYRWNGSGHLWGGLFNVGWHPIKIGDLKIGGEIGMVIYKATWREVIQPMDYSWQYQYDQKTKWERSPEIGFSAYYKNVYAAYRMYMIPDGANIVPGYRSPVHQLVMGVTF